MLLYTLDTETDLTENCDFRLFAANRKTEMTISVCLLQTETEKKFVFLGRQTMNWN